MWSDCLERKHSAATSQSVFSLVIECGLGLCAAQQNINPGLPGR